MKKTAKLETLIKELETFNDERKQRLLPIIGHARDDSYSREVLIRELRDAKFGYFANKLKLGYYDANEKEV